MLYISRIIRDTTKNCCNNNLYVGENAIPTKKITYEAHPMITDKRRPNLWRD